MCIVHLQERAAAEAANRPVPPSHSSNDVRALRISDFIHAHEKVCPHFLLVLYFDTLGCASVTSNALFS